MTRKGGDVLLVHRPRYDDWSFPKGKLDPGEHAITAAVREVAEETGLDVRLGPALPGQRYPLATVAPRPSPTGPRGWSGTTTWAATSSTTRSTRSPGCRGTRPRAGSPTSYDRETLDEARALRRKTWALVVLRHARARSRKAWKDDDHHRPLLLAGGAQAQRLIPLLAAFDATAIHSSSSVRCVTRWRRTATPRAGRW